MRGGGIERGPLTPSLASLVTGFMCPARFPPACVRAPLLRECDFFVVLHALLSLLLLLTSAWKNLEFRRCAARLCTYNVLCVPPSVLSFSATFDSTHSSAARAGLVGTDREGRMGVSPNKEMRVVLPRAMEVEAEQEARGGYTTSRKEEEGLAWPVRPWPINAPGQHQIQLRQID